MNIDFSEIFSVDVTMVQTFLVLFSATLAGFFIALTYKKTHRGLSYSPSFTTTLLLVTVITAVVLMVIGDNVARAIGMFGAFSVIRFRTAIKDPRDLVFVFLSLVSGFAIGAGAIWVASISIPFLLSLILLVYYTGFGELPRFDYILHVKVESKEYDESVLAKFLEKNVREHQLLNVESREKGSVLLLNFNLILKSKIKMDQVIKALHKQHGVREVYAVRSKNDLDF